MKEKVSEFMYGIAGRESHCGMGSIGEVPPLTDFAQVRPSEREFFIDNLLVRIHYIFVMIR